MSGDQQPPKTSAEDMPSTEETPATPHVGVEEETTSTPHVGADPTPTKPVRRAKTTGLAKGEPSPVALAPDIIDNAAIGGLTAVTSST